MREESLLYAMPRMRSTAASRITRSTPNME
jgi:hypothetical protein